MRKYQILRTYHVKYVATAQPKVVLEINITALGAADAVKHFETLAGGKYRIERMDIMPETATQEGINKLSRSAFGDLSGVGLSEMLGTKPISKEFVVVGCDTFTVPQSAYNFKCNVDGRYES